MLLKVPRLSREVWLNVLYLSESEKERYALYLWIIKVVLGRNW